MMSPIGFSAPVCTSLVCTSRTPGTPPRCGSVAASWQATPTLPRPHQGRYASTQPPSRWLPRRSSPSPWKSLVISVFQSLAASTDALNMAPLASTDAKPASADLKLRYRSFERLQTGRHIRRRRLERGARVLDRFLCRSGVAAELTSTMPSAMEFAQKSRPKAARCRS